MESPVAHNLFHRRPIIKSKTSAVKWVREWVTQHVVATGGRCTVLRWVREDTSKTLKENETEPEVPDPEPEPTSEVLFLCSYEGCGKTFIDAGALRKHSHIHGERQYVCHFDGCGKKFLDSSKLKRHFLIHTGERDFVCPYAGCGKAFSLDFNLKSHMKTHSQENYHICPYQDCGKRYAHEYKLRNHIAAYHEKNVADVMKFTPPAEKLVSRTTKPSPSTNASAASLDRPYACPYEGCNKAYIHEYKLNLHLRKEHPEHHTVKTSQSNNIVKMEIDEARGNNNNSYSRKRGTGSGSKQAKDNNKPNLKQPPSKIMRKGNTNVPPASLDLVEKQWPTKDNLSEEEDSEKTEEDCDNGEDGRRYGENNEDDDEETEYED